MEELLLSDTEQPNTWSRGLIMCRDPVILLSSIDPPLRYLGVASGLPDIFQKKPSLHFLSPSWSLLDTGDGLARSIHQAAIDLPLARFVVLASDEQELHALYKAGLEAILGNHNIFVNEKIFRPLTAETQSEFDAIYNAKFAPFKNHHLCKNIERLALVHYKTASTQSNETEVRAMLPHARILNDENAAGTHRNLSPPEVAAAVSRAATGLCLSAKEGAMIASMEYLLCGTPVVSIRSHGGRERYLLPPYTEFAEPDPDSVARAVQRLKQRRLPRAGLHQYVLTLLTLERRNFLEAINLKITDMFGPGREIKDFEPFRHSLGYVPTDVWSRALIA
jgi:hypothetical protein